MGLCKTLEKNFRFCWVQILNRMYGSYWQLEGHMDRWIVLINTMAVGVTLYDKLHDKIGRSDVSDIHLLCPT